jgi:hypothetical protein
LVKADIIIWGLHENFSRIQVIEELKCREAKLPTHYCSRIELAGTVPAQEVVIYSVHKSVSDQHSGLDQHFKTRLSFGKRVHRAIMGNR